MSNSSAVAGEIVTYGGLVVSAPRDAQIPPHVAAAMALLLAAHYKEIVPRETLILYGAMLAEYDAELLKFAAIECLNQIKWFPKLEEITEIIYMIRTLIDGRGGARGQKFEGKATINNRAELAEFHKRCKAETLDYIEREKQKSRMRTVADGAQRYLQNAREQLANARSDDSIAYWTEYIAQLEARAIGD